MKKILYVLILFPLFSYGQDSTLHRALGISFSNDLCYRLTSAENELTETKKNFDSLEVARYGYTFGVFGGYNVSPNFSVQAGLNFSRRGYAIDTLEEAGLVNMKFSYSFIEVPLRVRYVLRTQRKIQPVVTLGFNTGFLLRNKTFYNEIGIAGRKTYQDGQKMIPINFGIVASLGFQKNIWPNYIFQLDGVYRQSITPLSDTPLKRHLFSAGVNLSLMRLF